MPNLIPFLRKSRVAWIALSCALVSLYFFAPRLVYWRLLPIEQAGTTAEVIRAQAALAQLEHPFAHFTSDVNRVLHWRLFFPLLGRALHLPPKVYLALPHLGAILVLLLAGWLLAKHEVDTWTSLAITTLLATSSWFFVSIGWLGYFDSWFVLGVMAVVFTPGWQWNVVATLATPWIDERFVVILPFALILRLGYTRAFPRPDVPDASRTIKWILAALIPWLAIRLFSFAAGEDPTTNGYLRGMYERQAAIPAYNYLQGIWHGLRFAWVPVFAWLVLARKENSRHQVVLPAAFAGMLILNVFIASDIGRSMSVFLPAAMLGALLWWRQDRPGAGRALRLAAVLNLIFPAVHVTGAVTWPVRYLYTELDSLENPPPGLTPQFYVERALALMNQGDFKGAVANASIAIKLDGDTVDAYGIRASAHFRLTQHREALADADVALARQPHNPLYQNNRAHIRAAVGDLRGAIADLEQLLREPALASPLKEQALATLAELQRKLHAPPP